MSPWLVASKVLDRQLLHVVKHPDPVFTGYKARGDARQQLGVTSLSRPTQPDEQGDIIARSALPVWGRTMPSRLQALFDITRQPFNIYRWDNTDNGADCQANDHDGQLHREIPEQLPENDAHGMAVWLSLLFRMHLLHPALF